MLGQFKAGTAEQTKKYVNGNYNSEDRIWLRGRNKESKIQELLQLLAFGQPLDGTWRRRRRHVEWGLSILQWKSEATVPAAGLHWSWCTTEQMQETGSRSVIIFAYRHWWWYFLWGGQDKELSVPKKGQKGVHQMIVTIPCFATSWRQQLLTACCAQTNVRCEAARPSRWHYRRPLRTFTRSSEMVSICPLAQASFRWNLNPGEQTEGIIK